MNGHHDVSAIKAALSSRLRDFVRTLCGEPNRHISSRTQWRYGRKGSLAIEVEGPKAGLWADLEAAEGGDILALVLRQRGGSFPEAIAWAVDFLGTDPHDLATSPAAPVVVLDDPADRERRTALALSIWRQAIAPRGTIVEAYLASRGIVLPDAVCGATIRFHGALHLAEGGRAPGMVALMRNVDSDEPQAIHRTFLHADGTKLGKKMLGAAGGAAIKLSADEEVHTGLVIGEGIETCLSALAMGLGPIWALGSAGAIARFPALGAVEALTICLEDDAASRRAVAACATRWQRAGREVLGARDPLGGDLNDAIRRAA